ncbi:MAG: hypothetical protein K2X01_10085 [Cyanobacteria bacterium]|nr:hypothetical protein [Cyanobacteriota bacterium]
MEFNRDEIHYLTEAGPVMLSFEKRRYDGGPEIEVIQYIEAQRAAQEAFAQFEWHES